MLITCPSCAAEYNVPGPVAPGRAVRCARCSTQWAPTPLPPPPVVAPVFEPPVEPPVIDAVSQPILDRPSVAPIGEFRRAAPATRPPASRLPLLLAWSGSVLLLVLIAAAAVVWREPVMQAWPPSIRVYDAIGLGTRA